MPRRRKSFQELSDTGAIKHDRKRYADRENELTDHRPLGDPPDFFDDQDRTIWYEIVADLRPGFLSKADRKILELTTCLVRRSRLDPDRVAHTLKVVARHLQEAGTEEEEATKFQESMLRELTPTAGETRLMMSCFASIGMTPRERK